MDAIMAATEEVAVAMAEAMEAQLAEKPMTPRRRGRKRKNQEAELGNKLLCNHLM